MDKYVFFVIEIVSRFHNLVQQHLPAQPTYAPTLLRSAKLL